MRQTLRQIVFIRIATNVKYALSTFLKDGARTVTFVAHLL